MSTKTVAIIPEIIFCVHVFEVEDGIFTSEDDFVPENDLKLKGNVGINFGGCPVDYLR